MKFKEFGLDSRILSAINKHGYKQATPIQEKAIPLIMENYDVIGQAQTGTGKTAAFGLPILEKINPKNKNIQSLIISPTRELAVQTKEELNLLGSDKKIKTEVVFGGADIRHQIKLLKNNPQIVVGTPGRLIDHINRQTIDLNSVNVLVLDEADEMLDMGFLEDIGTIISYVPKKRQTLLFSATIPKNIEKVGLKFMKKPKEIYIAPKKITIDLVDQYFVDTNEATKFNDMTKLFDVQQPKLAIIFARTKKRVDELTRALKLRGYNASGVHGDLDQSERLKTLKSFRKKELQFLVATDVAARGLDISGVTHVYNYDIPQDPDSYVHRIGRTGRAGKQGISITFVNNNEVDYLLSIEKLTNKKMILLKVPTDQEAHIARLKNAKYSAYKVLKKISNNKISSEANEISSEYNSKILALALLDVLAKDEEKTRPVKITREKPLPIRNKHKNNRNKKNKNKKIRKRFSNFQIKRHYKPADRRKQKIKSRPGGNSKIKPKKRKFKIIKEK